MELPEDEKQKWNELFFQNVEVGFRNLFADIKKGKRTLGVSFLLISD